jgi:Secretion system C-terminal sorting domain
MKKLFFAIITMFCFNTGYNQTNIPNGNLEKWYQVVVNDTLNYWQPGIPGHPNFLATLDTLASIAFPIGPGPVTVERTTDKYSGIYAAKLTSKFFATPNVFIPGMLGTASLDMLNIRAIIGRACAGCKPIRFTGYYKSEPVNGDSVTAVILVSKWNAGTHHRDTIGFGKMVEHNTVSTYTKFDIPVIYTGISGSPDSLSLLMVSSAGFSVINFMGGVGQVGSTMYVDELMLEYPQGIQQVLLPDVNVNTFPNPAKDILTIQLSDKVKDGTLEVYNLEGKQVGIYHLTDLTNRIPVYSLINGTYYYKLKDGIHVLNTGSFIIQK